MIILKKVSTPLELADLLTIASENTYHEYDCDRDTYLDHIVRNMYRNPNYRMMLLVDNTKVVGYFITYEDNFLYKELRVVDVFLLREYQGKSLIQLFITDIYNVGIKVGAHRIKWHSHVFGKEFWEKHSLEFPVSVHEVFHVDLKEI